MIWIGRLFLLGLALFFGGLALGYGFDDGGRQVGFAEAMTTIAVVMYLASWVLLPLAALLFLAALIPKPTHSGLTRLDRLVLGTIYAVWLVVPLAVLAGLQSDRCMATNSCHKWGVSNVIGALILTLLPFPVFSLARKVAARLMGNPPD